MFYRKDHFIRTALFEVYTALLIPLQKAHLKFLLICCNTGFGEELAGTILPKALFSKNQSK